MTPEAKILFSILTYRVGQLPLCALTLLSFGIVWWFVALFRTRFLQKKKNRSLLVCLPPFFSTVVGGTLLLIFLDNLLLGAAVLFSTALLFALPDLLLACLSRLRSVSHTSRKGDAAK